MNTFGVLFCLTMGAIAVGFASGDDVCILFFISHFLFHLFTHPICNFRAISLFFLRTVVLWEEKMGQWRS